MSAPVMVGPPPSRGGPTRPLTKLELRVLQYISEGLTYAEIGQETGYSRDSVLKASTRILRKLNARNRAHAVFLACQMRILDPTRRHGDHAGFAAHRYRGEEPCEACWEGERAYRAERRAARKAAHSTAA
ncbi:helix-turn-helix transcriptional regulator (plasmid) [Streptomyces chartreusis]|uniref:helix-turn-helix domain-containing protein n=1 Tax=Streptomyces chartreusis TaxID=1969 RepID=UPI0037DD8262|nr:helix-turn-helix transcriptional regulator [Streptomyces chartreusis]